MRPGEAVAIIHPELHEKLSSRGIDLRGLTIADGDTFCWKGFYEYDLNTAHTVRTDLNVFKGMGGQLI